jgi:hypothetical protein
MATRKKKDGRKKPRSAKQKAAAKRNGARLAKWNKTHSTGHKKRKTAVKRKSKRGPGRPRKVGRPRSKKAHHTKSVRVGNAVVTVSVKKT